MTYDFSDAIKNPDVEASLEEKKIYAVQRSVKHLIDFVVISFEELGIDKFKELVDPSLDQIERIIIELDTEAKGIGDTDLQQYLLTAQIMIKNAKSGNPELCSSDAKFLKNANIVK